VSNRFGSRGECIEEQLESWGGWATYETGQYDFTLTDAAPLLNLDPDFCSSCKPLISGVVSLNASNHWGLKVDPPIVHSEGRRYYVVVAGMDGSSQPWPPSSPNARAVLVRSSQLTQQNLSDSLCKLPPLSPITDADAQLFEAQNGQVVDEAHLTPQTQTALACFRNAIATHDGTIFLRSAWRPPAYQKHLQEVWDRWWALRDLTPEELAYCTELVADITEEWDTHDIDHRPATNSPHPQGRAFDANVNVPGGPDGLAQLCGLIRPLPAPAPIGDPNHYVLN
jgi:hypothetical protein